MATEKVVSASVARRAYSILVVKRLYRSSAAVETTKSYRTVCPLPPAPPLHLWRCLSACSFPDSTVAVATRTERSAATANAASVCLSSTGLL